MKAVAVLLLLVAVASASELAFKNGEAQFPGTQSNCFPACTWNCDRPSCPARCEPQCEKPQCELRCEKLPETACDIRCEKPKCEVRCSRRNCQSGGCPLCENVCLPAKCQTVCTPAIPKCKPTCSAPKCTWSCRKPTTCPKPKCNLGCAPHPTPACGNPTCCSCHTFANMQSAIELASTHHRTKHGKDLEEEMMPAMVEIAHEFRLRSGESGQQQCCPCSQNGGAVARAHDDDEDADD